MEPIPINLAVEDALSEAVLLKLIAVSGRPYHLGSVYRKGGFGYLKRTIVGWNRAARSVPFLVLTDLDDSPCATALIDSWLAEPPHPNLIFRIAVREVEAWILADVEGFAEFAGIKPALLPEQPENLASPKEHLVSLVGRSPRASLRAQIIPKRGSTARVGPEYNQSLCEFTETQWNPARAASRSKSLERAIARLAAFQIQY